MANQLKVGELVQLKSGGPVMTVKEKLSIDYRCQWFAGKKLETGVFPPDSLQPAAAPPAKAST
jgi:uncharacterized protein YodC (DUF2158 family)